MAEMLVDGAKLDACNTAEADAIRAKTGGTDPIPYDFTNNKGFADAIAAIPTGGEDNLVRSMNGQDVHLESDELNYIGIVPRSIKSVRSWSATAIRYQAFRLVDKGLQSCFAPNAVVHDEAFKGCTALKTLVCKRPISDSAAIRILSEYVKNAMTIERVEFTDTNSTVGVGAETFLGNKNLTLLILRSANLLPLKNLNAFMRTPYDSGGSGGTIYIPKALYDHLGDGTSLDYKAATNWSTIDGYGTITWAKIEGSIYETQYADGTPIPTT